MKWYVRPMIGAGIVILGGVGLLSVYPLSQERSLDKTVSSYEECSCLNEDHCDNDDDLLLLMMGSLLTIGAGLYTISRTNFAEYDRHLSRSIDWDRNSDQSL
ncbi:hypothetical protein HOC80_01990 [archaeon]|jgi:hypothetical protein|nr:hypothetical protein [archaeon]MBT4416853.1 hypothetical protein [archaeon]